ncbi:beta-ketoacyl synthase N-terminal-like domain-containing protein [Streptomyces harbinensis]|uniref:beta-ketoacyl synthase N-terminal-like domain-containing protein n=1 Tax=Streptomyces harbinensis TaxID=1176198 RepID=UPI003392275F
MTTERESDDLTTDVAVIGMAGRFPGARDLTEFWQLVSHGLQAAQPVSDADLVTAGVPAGEREDPHYVPVWSGIEGADLFDAEFFGYTPREAALIDPQHRLLLECAWHALEDAGHHPGTFAGDIAVYAGCGMNLYLLDHVLPHRDLVRATGRFTVAVSSDKDNLSTRLSYKLNLTGPSLTVQSNCSTGPVALHHAVNALLNHECDMALVGTSSVKNPQPRGYLHEPGGTSTPDGVCRSFDEGANGYFLGDGVGAVVLRRREDAERSGDRVYALIKGSAVTNDGGTRPGYAAPSKAGQAAAVERALRVADVAPASLQYVEANGSATPTGDAIEVAALREAFDRAGGPPERCAIGALKPNVGNLDTTSGLASFIKTVLALAHGQLPPSINYGSPDPATGLDRDVFFVNDRLRPWPEAPGPRRAGVSSFGVGGTNVHLVLQEAPVRPPTRSARTRQVLTVSARTPEALTEAREALAAHLERAGDTPLADVAFTLGTGRRPFASRFATVVRDTTEAVAALRGPGAAGGGDWPQDAGPLFWLPGLCAPPVPIVRSALYRREPAFRAAADEAARAVADRLAIDALTAGPRPGGDPDPLADRAVTFVFLTALLRTLADWGVRPRAALGSGAGAVAAMVATGVLSPADAADRLASRDPDPATESIEKLLAGQRPTAIVVFGEDTAARPLAEHHGLPLLSAFAPPAAGGEDEDGTEAALLGLLGDLWQLGAAVDWAAFHRPDAPRRTSLPGYPFERARHWLDAAPPATATAGEPAPNPAAPVPGRRPRVLTSPPVAPRSPLERIVVEVWREKLGIADIGVTDSFLELGGDSLAAAQILAELNEAFCVELSLRVFLQEPTAATLAGSVADLLREAGELRRLMAAVDGPAVAAPDPGER